MNKIPVPNETCLVEIVSDAGEKNHCVYFLDENGELIDHLEISDCLVSEIVIMIPHMFIIHFTDQQFFNMRCATSFNMIFEPEYIYYNDLFSWQMDKKMMQIIRFFGKLKNVHNFSQTTEYKSEKHIISDFVSQKPTEIEETSKEVHEKGMLARARMMEIIKNWVY
jgi:hypothetical protein